MRMNMKILLVWLLLVIPIIAQDDGPRPDRWRGMVIDESTPDDAIKAFGKPDRDEVGGVRFFYVEGKLLSKRAKEKTFRTLEWKKLEGLDGAKLSFREGRLARICLDLSKEKEFAAASISGIYKLEFRPRIDSISEGLFGPVGGRPDSGLKNVSYPVVYSLLTQTERVWLAAMVGNSGFKHAMFGDGDTSKDTGAYPGRVQLIEIVSRTLENRDGAEVLR
jgi:hypothetical protein